MQDIVFYVAANETLGLVRDYANMHRADAPVLTIGVAVCLRMRLFADIEVSTPYPIASFSGITNWRWSMDADFDRSTACKLVADEDGISVHTVTDTVSGETRSFTEFVIPISNMNTQELAAWLGNESTRSGLTGELVGYDNNGNAIFVLQVENFTVRNRVAGLCDPTAVDEGIVTRSVAEQMIQTAVFSLAATKQDKLTASNGGTGISVTSTGIISVSNVPQSAVTGLSASLAGKQNALAFGWGLDHDYLDDVLSLARYRTVYSPTGATVTIVPGEAYKINAAASAKMIEAASIPDNTWGLEGHLEIFVAGTGYVQTGENVFLANALKPDAVNNCTVRFHDGYAIISVEDHIAGYIVMVNATSGSGSLNYALGVSTEYISVDASLNGQTLDLAGAVTNGEKHVVGNGYTETIISGGINCTSKTTLSNLAADGVIVSSGTLTLGDVFIPSGSTVAVSGGGLAVEKVVGAGEGSVIDLTREHIVVAPGRSAYASGCTFTSGGKYPEGGGVFQAGSTYVAGHCQLQLDGCVVSGNSANYGGGINAISTTVLLSNSIISGNQGTQVKDLLVASSGGQLVLLGGNTLGNVAVVGCEAILYNRNKVEKLGGATGYATITSGATVDLTGNTNATPITPGGGITFEAGGATVYPSAGQASAYMLGGITVPTIGNTNVVNLGETSINLTDNSTSYIFGATVTSTQRSFLFDGSNIELRVSNATVNGQFFFRYSNNTLYIEDSVLTGNIGVRDDATVIGNAVHINGSNTLGLIAGTSNASMSVVISSGASINLTSSINPGGDITVLTGGCTVNGVTVEPGTYTSIVSSGGSAVINQ